MLLPLLPRCSSRPSGRCLGTPTADNHNNYDNYRAILYNYYRGLAPLGLAPPLAPLWALPAAGSSLSTPRVNQATSTIVTFESLPANEWAMYTILKEFFPKIQGPTPNGFFGADLSDF